MAKIFGLVAIALLWLSACASINDAGRAYFRKGDKVKGVEPAETLLVRLHKEQELRDIVYGQLKSAKVVQCTLLRNQLYVASVVGASPKEVKEVVKLMEAAYQDNDAAFLAACDQIVATPVGKAFVAIQQEYLTKAR